MVVFIVCFTFLPLPFFRGRYELFLVKLTVGKINSKYYLIIMTFFKSLFERTLNVSQTSETMYDDVVPAASVIMFSLRYCHMICAFAFMFQVFNTYIFQVEKTECQNCLIWCKSDNLVRDVIKLSSEITVRSSLVSLICIALFSCF